ncbi:hypothetical protein QN277_020545 [Acacia crassicarpa]|uniref:Exocyst subunit Exo70 family protein n=1 Tax=Acacia crassicarpa TaxID=499986 RepID=A0AAE1KD92_9FABA|nr:hypothetical protein QN277_020545 [Acacia crassicarpa]
MATEESDSKHVLPELENEEDLIAAAKDIVRALGSNRNLTIDAKKILADLGTRLASMTEPCEKKEGDEGEGGQEEEEEKEVSAVEDRLNIIEEKIMRWEEDRSWIWDSGPDEISEYLAAADEARQLIEKLERSDLKRDDQEYKSLLRAYSVLQTAMARLEEEFMNLLIQYKQPFEPEYMSFRSSEDDPVDEGFIVPSVDDSTEESLPRESVVSRGSEEHIIDLVHPHVIPELRSIAQQMFDSKYDRECSHAYTVARRESLEECLVILEMERLSIEDVLKMQWGTLNSKIKRWVWAVKIFVRVYLASEKWLSDQIFGEGEPVSISCFIDASKASIFQLLTFGDAMSIGPHQPEKLFRGLDMYEALAELIPEIDALYPHEVGSSVRIECHEVLTRLGDCVKLTFLEFENAIATNASTNPFVGGGIHPLTRYVMNYLNTLADYGETLNFLLKNKEEDDTILLSPDMSPDAEENSKFPGSPSGVSSMALHFRSVASILQCKLDEKSKLYRDAGLQHLFLMNNIHYMAQKVKGSELRLIYGDEWIRKHNWKFQQHAMSYERASWSSILSLLKDDVHASISKSPLKENLQRFYLAFEDVYKSQTAWSIPDVQLREDLRISISLKVIHAYRTFVGRHSHHISDKHVKYNADDLENYLLDFFEGSPKSLQNPHRR